MLKKGSLIFLIVLIVSGCKNTPNIKPPPPVTTLPGTWTQLADFSGGGRARAFGFTIGSKGYILGGHTGQGATFKELSDFWEYDPATDKWTQKADYPGQAWEYIRGFSIGSKGYVGTGFGQKDHILNSLPENREFYEYDPSTDTWTKKADFGGVERENAVAFEINGIGYMGLGTDYTYQAQYKDFWKYDPSTDKWTQVATYPGIGVYGAAGFSCNGKGYVGLGGAPSNILAYDFWQYDPSADKWAQKSSFFGDARWLSGQFVIGSNGYVGFGRSATQNEKDFWAYNTVDDTWARMKDFPAGTRWDLVSFAINNTGYIGTGNGANYADFWKFTP